MSIYYSREKPHAPVHSAVGAGMLSATHAAGYVHPATAVTPGAVSALSNHPFPILAVTLAAALPLGVGVTNVSVGTLPVAVYVGSSVSAPASTFDIVAGGHWPN